LQRLAALTDIETSHVLVSSPFVMAGLVPAIHVLFAAPYKDVDVRHKAGHDERARLITRAEATTTARRRARSWSRRRR
jgi:hypothetical protein